MAGMSIALSRGIKPKNIVMTDKNENPSIAAELAEDDRRDSEPVRAIIKSLSKFIQGKKIYAKNNPTLVKFAKEFDASLQAFFNDEDELVLTIEQYQIKWCDQPIYANDKRDESIAFLLYKDGIGELSIHSSVTFNELESFVDVLKDEVHSFKTGEDVVTKLWKADFENIAYRVLDEYLVGQFGEGKLDEAKKTPLETEDHPDLPSFEDKGREIVGTSEELESITTYLNHLLDQSHPMGSPEDREKRFEEMADSFFMINNEELRLCREELSSEKEHDALVDFLETIIDFTLLSDNHSVVRDTSNVIESIVDYLIEERNAVALAGTLEAIRSFFTGRSLDENLTTFFEHLEEKLTDTNFLTSLNDRISEGSPDVEEVFAYYRAVGKRAAPTICALLEHLEGPRLHRIACDTLIDVAGDDIPLLIEKLSIDVPRVAQDAIYLIEKSDTKELPYLVEELMYYPDDRVRDEVIGYLARIGTGDAITLLIRLIDDVDKRIRIKTMAAIRDLNSPIILNKLIAVAFDKQFAGKTFDEQEQLFRVVGKQAGNDILPHIRSMIEKKSRLPFMKNQTKQNKLLAIRALENIATPESMNLLRVLAEDANDLVKSMARRALRVGQEPANTNVES